MLLLFFLHTHGTVTITLALIFIPKVIFILQPHPTMQLAPGPV